MRIKPGDKKNQIIFNDGTTKTLTRAHYNELLNYIDKATHQLYNLKIMGGNTNEINEKHQRNTSAI